MTESQPEPHYFEVGVSRGIPCKLCYELHGEGDIKILFIMGFITPRQSWDHQIEYFTKEGKRKKYQVCVYDNRGMGDSVCPRITSSTRVLAEDAIELVDHLGWEKFHLVGLSMGGMIAQELSLIAGQRLQSLTLAVTHAGGRFAVTGPTSWVHFASFMLATSPEDRVKAILALNYSKKFLKENYEKAFKWHTERHKEVSPNGLLQHLSAVLTHYVTYARLAKLKEYKIPTLVLSGTEDKLVLPANAKVLKKALKADLVILKGLGHMIHSEDPETFNALLEKHVDKALTQGTTTTTAEGNNAPATPPSPQESIRATSGERESSSPPPVQCKL